MPDLFIGAGPLDVEGQEALIEGAGRWSVRQAFPTASLVAGQKAVCGVIARAPYGMIVTRCWVEHPDNAAEQGFASFVGGSGFKPTLLAAANLFTEVSPTVRRTDIPQGTDGPALGCSVPFFASYDNGAAGMGNTALGLTQLGGLEVIAAASAATMPRGKLLDLSGPVYAPKEGIVMVRHGTVLKDFTIVMRGIEFYTEEARRFYLMRMLA